MKLVCGLGNPGPEYENTRHNVGWWLIDRLSAQWGFGRFRREGSALRAGGERAGTRLELLKPLTYMNRSGPAVAAAVRRYPELDPIRDLLVIVDEAALDVGRLRLRPSGSAGGHNGLKSVESALGTREYARLRIGVGPPPPEIDLADWVLSPFSPEDEDRILALLPDAAAAVETWVHEGAEAAMSRYNR